MKLFERGNIGTMALKNRIVMCPMGTGRLADLDGGFSQRIKDYFAARAAGGVGLIISGGTTVTTAIEPGLAQLATTRIDGVAHLSRLSEFCDAIHHHGAKIAIQLSAGVGRVSSENGRSVSASAVPCLRDPSIMTRELTTDEIKTIIEAYGRSARIASEAGADAIEIHGYGGYLTDQFMTSLWNKRTDAYGGQLEGRLRFPLELIEAVQGATGGTVPIIFKFTVEHYLPGGRTIEEGLDIARRLEKAGVAALHVSGGCFEVWHRTIPCMHEPPAGKADLSAAVKNVVRIPVIVDGKLGDPNVAEKVLQEQKADFIGLGRPLLADPDWPVKVEQGKPEDIRPCVGDLEGCLGRTMKYLYMSCTVNPCTGMEREYALAPAGERKSVVVVGGGPAGMEAALVAASRGHRVTLLEKGGQLGGNLIAASRPEFKKDLRPLIEYLSTQIRKAGVKVEFQVTATPEVIARLNSDIVIVATGATPLIPSIPGMELDNVMSAVDVLLKRKKPGERVVVAGGGMVGCETAVYLAQEGRRVTIVEMMGRLIPEMINPISDMGLRSLVATNAVSVLTGTRLIEVSGRGATVETSGTREIIQADSVVLALGFRPEQSLLHGLEGKVPELRAIGDCVQPRRIINAMWEGYHTSRLI